VFSLISACLIRFEKKRNKGEIFTSHVRVAFPPRAQVRTLQALLRKVDAHSKTLSRELMLRDRAHGPVMKKNAEEKMALESKVERLALGLYPIPYTLIPYTLVDIDGEQGGEVGTWAIP
jgi:hypothetical protein